MYILSRKLGRGDTGLREVQDQPATRAYTALQYAEKGYVWWNQEGGSPVGSWEGMVESPLPCPSYPVRVDATGVPTLCCSQGAVCFPVSQCGL